MEWNGMNETKWKRCTGTGNWEEMSITWFVVLPFAMRFSYLGFSIVIKMPINKCMWLMKWLISFYYHCPHAKVQQFLRFNNKERKEVYFHRVQMCERIFTFMFISSSVCLCIRQSRSFTTKWNNNNGQKISFWNPHNCPAWKKL